MTWDQFKEAIEENLKDKGLDGTIEIERIDLHKTDVKYLSITAVPDYIIITD
jgi:hypothetical protein